MVMRGTAQRLCFYAGLGLVTAATLMLQIIETRIISVTSWYHLAFFVISLAMFGLTAGAVWVYLRGDAFRPEQLSHHLARASLGFALTTALALVAQLTLATGMPNAAMTFLVWAEVAICLSVPFFFSGIVVSLALTRSPYPVGRVYGADLLGAALGCLGVLALLNMTDGPSAVLWVAALVSGAALLFVKSGLGGAPERGFGAGLVRRRWIAFAGLVTLALGNSLTAHGIRPVFVKGALEAPENFAYEKWNSFSRVTVTHSAEDPPALWGPSPRMPEQRVQQRWMNMDGAAGTAVYKFAGLKDVDFLRYDVTNLAHAIPGHDTAAVIGVGGGRDLLSARLFGVKDVTGVEINPIFIDLLTRRLADYTAIAGEPGVHFEVDEARSWFARTDRRFDIIQMSLIDTWAATGAGAFTLSENGLYTVEAWRIFLSKLTPDGVFTVSRWYGPGEVNETGRMASLAVATLQARGVAAPQRHIFVAAGGNIATLVLGNAPLSEAALAALRKATTDLGFTILIDPASPAASPLLQRIVEAPDGAALAAATDDSHLDLTPTTDSRPFFFNQLRFSRLLDPGAVSWRPGVYTGNLVATMTLAILVLVSALLVTLTIVVPLRPTLRHSGRVTAFGGTMYFALIGVGFMMAEIALLQRMSVFLGHPVYALSIVLFSLILATGLGSFVSERFPLDSGAKLASWAALTGLYLLVMPFWLPDVLLRLDSAGLFVRAATSVLVLAPAGLLMGFGFPTGMRLVSAIDTRPTPWFWGINGAAGVLAASLAVFTSIAFSIDTTLRLGGLCYLLLPAPALWLAAEALGSRRREAIA